MKIDAVTEQLLKDVLKNWNRVTGQPNNAKAMGMTLNMLYDRIGPGKPAPSEETQVDLPSPPAPKSTGKKLPPAAEKIASELT